MNDTLPIIKKTINIAFTLERLWRALFDRGDNFPIHCDVYCLWPSPRNMSSFSNLFIFMSVTDVSNVSCVALLGCYTVKENTFRSVFWRRVMPAGYWSQQSPKPNLVTLKMEATRSFETSERTYPIRCDNRGGCHLTLSVLHKITNILVLRAIRFLRLFSSTCLLRHVDFVRL